ncbi:hypothetical protein BDFB_000873 [Asbolus verrucosus]|uniref:Uncharacterized protein n=1 Tax=Asbolus verrucosus TaxID=1661398 RepID=A0A482V949_ASBVE|nr:hypothetical protein BDFB_000873 [Asbolus verrucosus]
MVSMAQRPSFAGTRAIGRPELAARFKDEDEPVPVNNRIGEDNEGGGLSNRKFVDRVNQWPRENRPFEVINAGHIESGRNSQRNQNFQPRSGFSQNEIASTVRRPSFAGSRPIGSPDLAARFRDEDESTGGTIHNRNSGGDTAADAALNTRNRHHHSHNSHQGY